MKQLYDMLVNLIEIGKANNMFLVEMEMRLKKIEALLDFTPSEPIATDSEEKKEQE